MGVLIGMEGSHAELVITAFGLAELVSRWEGRGDGRGQTRSIAIEDSSDVRMALQVASPADAHPTDADPSAADPATAFAPAADPGAGHPDYSVCAADTDPGADAAHPSHANPPTTDPFATFAARPPARRRRVRLPQLFKPDNHLILILYFIFIFFELHPPTYTLERRREGLNWPNQAVSPRT